MCIGSCDGLEAIENDGGEITPQKRLGQLKFVCAELLNSRSGDTQIQNVLEEASALANAMDASAGDPYADVSLEFEAVKSEFAANSAVRSAIHDVCTAVGRSTLLDIHSEHLRRCPR